MFVPSYYYIASRIANIECRVHRSTVFTYILILCNSRHYSNILIKIVLNSTFLSDNSTFVSALKLYLAIASPISPICAGGGGLAGCAFSGGESF